jgi:hypothetical protein
VVCTQVNLACNKQAWLATGLACNRLGLQRAWLATGLACNRIGLQQDWLATNRLGLQQVWLATNRLVRLQGGVHMGGTAQEQ